jgi:ABC-type transport system involved in cytochrome c biogenesis permease subunit
MFPPEVINMSRRSVLRTLSVAAVVAVVALGGVRGAVAARDLDFGPWKGMPVFENGRIMPLDTFARGVVDKVCGRTSPKLRLTGALVDGVSEDELGPATELFPDGEPRRFSAAELLFSWLIEPEKWERVPFLRAGHETLREELLDLPIAAEGAGRLKYVSPWQVLNATRFRERLAEISDARREAQQQGERFQPSDIDRKVMELYEAYSIYRQLTFNPTARDANFSRFLEKTGAAARSWRQLEPRLGQFQQLDPEGALAREVSAAGEAMQQLSALAGRASWGLSDVEPLVLDFRRAARSLSRQFAEHQRRLERDPPQWEAEQLERIRGALAKLVIQTDELARQANEMLLALYDNGGALRLVPALNPGALEENRDTSDDAQPWLSLQTLILGSDAVLEDYPQQQVQRVRESFDRAATTYVERSVSDRAARLESALAALASDVRALAEAIEPLRKDLPIEHRDDALIAATAYPPPGALEAELHYNEFDPFFWSWLVSLLAAVCFGLSFGILRRPMFWAGVVVLIAAQAVTIYGFGLRSYITGWAPVTNMFETVVFVALGVAVLGLWFTMSPMLWPGLLAAWRLTAVPKTPEADPPEEDELELFSESTWATSRWVSALVRAALGVWVFVILTMTPYGSGGNTVISLVPRTDVGSSVPTANDLLTWFVGLCVLVPTVWYVPRAAVSGVVALFTVPYTLRRQGLRKSADKALGRKPFAVVGAAVGFFAAYLAYYSPVFDQDINPLMPVLRDNFWLTIHVLTITASYAAGALAWGLGLIAMGYYLFGKYRDPVKPSADVMAQGHRPAGDYEAPAEAFTRRPPEECSALAGFIYKSMQVAVLLLAAGTILGGLWADVSWGRFWGWDPKEVWALISLLTYLAILHGRYAGWFGNFGLSVGSVIGATAILMAWYGVNFVLPAGLHSYGQGAGGQAQVAVVVALNWLFVAVAAVRYHSQRRTKVEPKPADADARQKPDEVEEPV